MTGKRPTKASYDRARVTCPECGQEFNTEQTPEHDRWLFCPLCRHWVRVSLDAFHPLHEQDWPVRKTIGFGWAWERCWCGVAGHGFDSEAAARADYAQHRAGCAVIQARS